MSFFIPQGPTIPGSSNYSDVQSSVVSTNNLIMPKSFTTIPSGTFDSIANIDGPQGTVQITFVNAIPPSTWSPGLMILQMTNLGVPLSATSLVFLSMINTTHTNGIPTPVILEILPYSPPNPGLQNGQIEFYINNTDSVDTINVGDVVTMAYFIIS